MPFVLHAGTFIVVATLALSVGQTWALASPWRRSRYLIVWLVASALMAGLGMRVLGLHWHDPILRAGPVGRSLVTIAGVLGAVSLGAGHAWGTTRGVETASFSRRVVVFAQAHVTTMLIGGALAYVLISIIRISQIH